MTLETLKQLFKFSWAQALSDYNGKTSITAICSLCIVITGCVGFLYSLFLKDSNGMMYSSLIIGTGAGLLGYKKKVDGKPGDMGIEETPTDGAKLQG